MICVTDVAQSLLRDLLPVASGDGGSVTAFGVGVLAMRWWETKSGRYWEDHAGPGPRSDKFNSDIDSRLKNALNKRSTIDLRSNTAMPDHATSWLDKVPVHGLRGAPGRV